MPASAAIESVWDYPRPPRVEPSSERVTVALGGRPLADTIAAVRVLETSHPPVYYVPIADIEMARLTGGIGTSFCEFKGAAVYWDADGAGAVGWSYPDPAPGYESLRDRIAFYPGRVEATLAGERVRPQAGGFYGGWITDRITGPFKGAPGTSVW